ADGRAIAAARGLGGVFVGDGIEFNSAHFLQNAGLRTALDDIIPNVKPAFATYSSYDSQNAGTMGDDAAALRGRSAPAELLMGEVGPSQHGIDGIDAFRTVATAKAIQRARLRAAVLWVGFDGSASGRVQPYGILDVDGGDRPVMQSL